MKEIVFLVEEADEGGFTVRALSESIFTQANSMDELRDQVRDAFRCHLGESKNALATPGVFNTLDSADLNHPFLLGLSTTLSLIGSCWNVDYCWITRKRSFKELVEP